MPEPSEPCASPACIVRDLGFPVHLAYSIEAWQGSSSRLQRLTHPDRILAYRRGRSALSLLLDRLGRSEDPGGIAFPHPEFSLSHTADLAVAAALPGGQGIGVDLEAPGRRVPEKGLRFFLDPRERLHHAGSDSETWLRLWTLKEALYKAHPANEALTLSVFSLDDPGAWLGTASGAGEVFRYGSWRVEAGWLALAVRTSRSPSTV